MSRLADPRGGDDYPAAAKKHLDDACVLEAGGRADGCAYHTGYVVESALKALLLHEASWDKASKAHVASRLKPAIDRMEGFGHGLRDLTAEIGRVTAAATSVSATYVPAASELAEITRKWKPSGRYRAEGAITPADSQLMLAAAKRIYARTIEKMRLDGVV